jgi:hypothetical protein
VFFTAASNASSRRMRLLSLGMGLVLACFEITIVRAELQIDETFDKSEPWTIGYNSSLKGCVAYKAAQQPAPPSVSDNTIATLERICPLECGRRQIDKDGRCVTKRCPSGFELDDDGDCTPRRRTATRHETDEDEDRPSVRSHESKGRARAVLSRLWRVLRTVSRPSTASDADTMTTAFSCGPSTCSSLMVRTCGLRRRKCARLHWPRCLREQRPACG